MVIDKRLWKQACATVEVLPGEMLSVWVDELPILVVNHDGQFYALEDKCSHEDYELSSGSFDPVTASVECTLHGAKFDVRDGSALCAPAYEPVRKYPTQVYDSAVWIKIEQDD